MKKSDLKKIIEEELLKEQNWKSLVGQVSKACDWQYGEIMDFVKALLIDCNFHEEAKKVYTFMDKI